ncbi:MAG: PIN domain-containing protein [Candidatus Latescibacterota bacterium]
MTSTDGSIFLDTNILVYAYDNHEPRKQAIARGVLRSAYQNGSGVVSAQVLGEFCAAVTHKIRAPMSPAEVRAILDEFAALRAVHVEPRIVHRALDLLERFQINYWDAQIIAAAGGAGCRQVLSEDLNPGQTYDGVVVVNPFAAAELSV